MSIRSLSLPLLFLGGLLAGCGDGSAPVPEGEAAGIAAAFDELADSIGTNGHEATSDALRHAADLVRLAGGATPVTVRIDDEPREFLAVAEQIDYPIIVCTWPDTTAGGSAPGEGECTETGSHSMRGLIAWEPDRMSEVVRIVADVGATSSHEDVPDVMGGLPSYEGTDSVVRHPGFTGEYIVRDVGSWWASEGSQTNSLEQEGGACTEDRVNFGWAQLACETATFSFEFAMTVEPAHWEYGPDGERTPSEASGSHRVSMSSSPIAGVRLTAQAWAPPLPEPVPLPPVDTVTTLQLEASLEAERDGSDVVLRFRVANSTGEAVTFDFPSGQRYDFSAVSSSGAELWRWSADKAFTGALAHITLEPGEAFDFEERWTPEGVIGPVRLQAELTSSNLPVVRTAEISL